MRADGSRAALAEQHNGDDEPPHDNEHICRFSGTQRTNRGDTHTSAAITPLGAEYVTVTLLADADWIQSCCPPASSSAIQNLVAEVSPPLVAELLGYR
jgi:hypothetical protein